MPFIHMMSAARSRAALIQYPSRKTVSAFFKSRLFILTRAGGYAMLFSVSGKYFLPGDTMPYHTVLPVRKLRAER